MRAVVSGRWPVIGTLIIAFAASGFLGCSVPNLEEPECTKSRDTVREFYSWYLATDAEQRGKQQDVLAKYVFPDAFNGANTATDRFVLTDDFPKAFRVGECKVVEPGKRSSLEVLLFWKDNVRSEQKSINVETESRDGEWLIKSVSPR